MSKRGVERAWKRWRETGELPVSRRKSKQARCLACCEDSLRRWVAERPEATLAKLGDRLERELGRHAGRLDLLANSARDGAAS